MPYGLYDGSLESIPGLGGWIQAQKLNDQRTAQGIHNSASVMQMIQAQKAMQDEDGVRQVLSQGGQPEQVLMGLTKLGKPGMEAASHYFSAVQAMNKNKALAGLDLTNADAVERASLYDPALAGYAKTIRERQAAAGEHAAQVSQETPITEMPQMGVRNGVAAERSIIAPGAMVPAGTLPHGMAFGKRGDPNATAYTMPTEPVPPEVLAAMQSGKPFSMGFGPSSNPAENTQRTGGAFSQFFDSPIVGRDAISKQTALDASNPIAIPPKSWNDKVSKMGEHEASMRMTNALAGIRSQDTQRGQDMRQDNQQRGQDMNRENILLRMGQNPDGTLNPTGEARAQLIATGKMAATSQDRGIMARVQQINPNWSNADYQVNLANEKAFGPGKKGDTIRSFSVAVDHLGTLGELADALDNGDFQVVNRVGNYFASQTGGPAPTNFNAAKALVADEIVKAVVGASGALGDREEAQRTISAANSPAQLKGVIDTYEKLMAGQLRGLHHQYTGSGGTKDFNGWLSEQAQQAMASHPAPGGAASANQVPLPNGTVKTFPSAAAAQGFKAAAGL